MGKHIAYSSALVLAAIILAASYSCQNFTSVSINCHSYVPGGCTPYENLQIKEKP